MEGRKITKAELDGFTASLHIEPTHRSIHHYRTSHYEIVFEDYLYSLISPKDADNTLPIVIGRNPGPVTRNRKLAS